LFLSPFLLIWVVLSENVVFRLSIFSILLYRRVSQTFWHSDIVGGGERLQDASLSGGAFNGTNTTFLSTTHLYISIFLSAAVHADLAQPLQGIHAITITACTSGRDHGLV
jgi:hypothetical protein